jgi:hypothetical protein
MVLAGKYESMRRSDVKTGCWLPADWGNVGCIIEEEVQGMKE